MYVTKNSSILLGGFSLPPAGNVNIQPEMNVPSIFIRGRTKKKLIFTLIIVECDRSLAKFFKKGDGNVPKTTGFSRLESQ